jgi:hypothetical protein
MRAQRREINIFNMSLLDILCGALGAFCFMMLVALPYYKPATNAAEIQKQREKTEELMRQIEKLRENLNEPGAARDLEELLKQLQAQIRSLQGQVTQLTAENEQLRKEKEQLAAQNQQLNARNQELTAQNQQLTAEKQQLAAQNQQLTKENSQLRVRTPFLVFVQSDIDLPLDLYVDDVLAKRANGERNPPFDPTKKRHDYFWPGDMDLYSLTRGVSTWMVRDVAPGSKFRLFVKVPSESVMVRSAIVNGRISGEGFPTITLPDVTLTLQRPWALVGTLTCPELGKLTFTEATEAERDAVWKELTKNASSPSPTATPKTNASATPPVSFPFGNDEKRAELERLRRERERLRGLSPSPSASAGGTATNRDERAEMLERARRERERRAGATVSPSVAPSPSQMP